MSAAEGEAGPLASAAGGGAANPAPSGAESRDLERRVAELEALVARLQAELERLRAVGAAGGTGESAGPAELERRIEALALEIERLRIGEAAAPHQGEPVPGFGPAASKVYRARKGVSIGGYGEALYQNFDDRTDDGQPSGATAEADLERAVFYFGYKFNDRLLFNSELEFEHAVAGEGEKGEVAVEFAYVDFKATRSFGARGGLLLVPVGFLNEMHEPPIFHGARRPEVERVIIPATWSEIGFGVYGDPGPISYRAYLVTSLDAGGFSAAQGIREGRQEGAEAKAADLAVTARVDYSPVPGLILGASVFTGKTGQDDPSLGRARVTLWDTHAEWNWRGLHLRGLYTRAGLGDADRVSLAVGEAVGQRLAGWYGEVAYNLLAPKKDTEQELSPFCRYESLNTQARVASGFTADPGNDRRVTTCGLTYKPIPNIAIKVDAQNLSNRAGSAVDQVNVALGYLF